MGILTKTIISGDTNTEPILTTAELQSNYGFKFPATGNGYYERMILAAQKACAKYLDMESLKQECSCSEVFEVERGQRSVVLSANPLASVVSVLDGSEARADYMVDLRSSVVFAKSGFNSGEVTVNYTIGWGNAVPEDVKYAVAMTVQHMARMANSALMGKNSMSTDGGSETYEQAIVPTAVRQYLDTIRKGKVL